MASTSTSKPPKKKTKKTTAEGRKTTAEALQDPSASTSSAADPAASAPLKQQEGQKPGPGSPPLEPWMRQTVVLKLKEVDGRAADMSQDVFGKKMVLEQGFAKPDVTSIHSFFAGMFWITFASVTICKRYWEMGKATQPDSPFRCFVGSCPVQREERRVTVAMRNPHIPGKNIVTYLKRFYTVMRDPTHILDGNCFWTGKWSVIVRLNRDFTDPDGVQHLPPTFSLGNSQALVYYSDMPQTCRKCGKKGHRLSDCKEVACWICRVTGHETRDCPKRTACKVWTGFTHLQGLPTKRTHMGSSRSQSTGQGEPHRSRTSGSNKTQSEGVQKEGG
ncbi:zinc finger CCHC domain-containing protein 3-like [Bufo bufo]|uniref:zinc finger CCHC domain-containing protein 3-like n=1 Tax=Bufo bufo TaxID=8384 RepID=UPI001ABDFF71|nr:zinc finger CCHC domain-containing protein 3-like [Bufo bufo]